MGWAVGYDSNWNRDVGYGVPAKCDHPNCDADIDRGLSYVCGGDVYGGEDGCGLFFCGHHLIHFSRKGPAVCERCGPRRKKPFTPKPDVAEWNRHKLTDESWLDWRDENPGAVAAIRALFAKA